MGRLTTHVLDTAHGHPAGGMMLTLHRIGDDGARQKLGTFVTNADGRCDKPLLNAEDFTIGRYELEFFAGDYFAKLGLKLPDPKFLDVVVIRFGIALANQHYHVPLLVSPYAYSTYRGS
jgi:5-hydroxyisourate hydrolase